jgi:HEPN domain-containing protein
MDEEKIKEIQRCLIKSQHDLGSANRLMEGEEPYLDTAVYHCQQAAEKAIKAYLTYRDFIFEKTHNLITLLATCISLDSRFKQWEEVAEILNPYATEFRYPREAMEPEKDDAEKALAAAKALVDFITQLFPNEVSSLGI